jgi:ATP diphosphatase
MTDELGDVLFAVVNLARYLEIDAEVALRGTNAKFERRFRHIEQSLLALGKTPEDATLEEMEALWQNAKSTEA